MSLLYGYNDDKSVKLEKPMIKTFETDITISEYGSPKTVKEFNSGIVLLGIVTKGSRAVSSKDLKVNYDFYDAMGTNIYLQSMDLGTNLLRTSLILQIFLVAIHV